MADNNKIKILFVIGQLGIGGAERQLVYLACNLERSLYEPIVCSFSKDAFFMEELVGSGITVEILPKRVSPDLTRFFTLYRLVKKYKPSIIHSYLFVGNTWARIVGKFTKTPVILSERSSQPRKPYYERVVNRLLYSFGSYLIANSKSGAKRIIENKEFAPEKVKIIYNGIPIGGYEIKVSQVIIEEVRSCFGIPDEKKVIGIIGRLDYAKNHELLFASFKDLQTKYPDCCILCIGDGLRREELKRIVGELGIQQDVIFTGFQKDIPQCLSVMDVLVLPSKWEGFPNVILEAMAARVPVIATNVGGVSEIISDGITGFLVNDNDRRDLARKVLIALSEAEKIEKITCRAYELVHSNYSIQRMVFETEKVYGNILGDCHKSKMDYLK